jgi:hypothetical protein
MNSTHSRSCAGVSHSISSGRSENQLASDGPQYDSGSSPTSPYQ